MFKIKYEYVLLSMVGCIVDGPTASLTAAGGNWKSLINVGLIMGVIAEHVETMSEYLSPMWLRLYAAYRLVSGSI